MAKRGFKLQEFVAHAADVNCLNIGKKSCRVFVTGGSDRIVNLWAIDTPNSLLSLSGHTTSVQSVAFDSAEVLVLAGASNGSIKLWDLEEGKIVRTLSGHRSSCTFVEFHPFGDFFASGSMDTDLKIWDIRKKSSIHTYKGHTRGIKTIKFTPDGRWVVTGGEDNIVKLWDLTAGKLLHDFKFHKGMIRCIDFHPHEFLLATGSADRTVKFWDLETFELIGSAGPEATGIRSMIFHPDGKTLFCALDEVLKVFSWEPIRCHDAVEMGWSSLADLSIYEEKLLGCSYHQNRVGVWVADISLVRPYATGFLLKNNSLMEPISSNVENSSVGLIGSGTKSKSPLVTGATDYAVKTKNDLGSLSFSSNECSQSPSQETCSMYSKSISSTLDGPKARAFTSNQIVSKKNDSGFSSRVSTLNSTTFRVAKAAEASARIPRKTTSNCSSRDISPNSDIVDANTLLSSNGHIMELHSLNDLQEVSIPVIVPRNLPNRGCSGAAETEVEVLACDMIFGNPDHISRTSSLESGNQSQILWTAFGSSRGMNRNLDPGNCNLKSGVVDNAETPPAVGSNRTSIKNVAEKFERIMLEQPAELQNDKSDDVPTGSSNGNCSVKYVRGVAVQLGKTRSLVERFERRESFSSHSPDKGPVMSSGKDLILVDDNSVCDVLLQNHDVFFNALKSRLTKLQVVRLFWKSNGIKEAIDAVAKLPDHSVQIDLVSVLREKIDEFTLELFSCLLPLLVGLVNSKTERHVVMTLEMLLELVKIFGPVVHSTISAPSFGGVDLHAEERCQRCIQCQNHLEKIKQNFPSLIRRGGLSAKRAEELNLVFQAL